MDANRVTGLAGLAGGIGLRTLADDEQSSHTDLSRYLHGLVFLQVGLGAQPGDEQSCTPSYVGYLGLGTQASDKQSWYT